MEYLTEKQEAVLKFIEEYQMTHGSSPTIREMKEHFQVASDNSILKHLKALGEKGYLVKDDTPRGIKLLNSVKEKLDNAAKIVSLPILGAIPAGGPAICEENIEDYMSLDESMVRYPDNSFLLRVRGDSMKNVGIMEEDIIVVDQQKRAKDGDTVVALVDGENTVKTYRVDNGQIYLQPENEKYENIYPQGELQIQGVVTGLVRAY